MKHDFFHSKSFARILLLSMTVVPLSFMTVVLVTEKTLDTIYPCRSFVNGVVKTTQDLSWYYRNGKAEGDLYKSALVAWASSYKKESRPECSIKLSGNYDYYQAMQSLAKDSKNSKNSKDYEDFADMLEKLRIYRTSLEMIKSLDLEK